MQHSEAQHSAIHPHIHMLRCTVLCCTALHCTVLHSMCMCGCIVLRCMGIYRGPVCLPHLKVKNIFVLIFNVKNMLKFEQRWKCTSAPPFRFINTPLLWSAVQCRATQHCTACVCIVLHCAVLFCAVQWRNPWPHLFAADWTARKMAHCNVWERGRKQGKWRERRRPEGEKIEREEVS